jgi:DNA-binding beta-propeller fold protein YncE
MDAEIIGAEIFVADQGNYRVQVFDLDGNWVESITFEGTDGENCNWFTGECEIPIFDSADRTYVTNYGEYGLSAGKLRVPMDVVVSSGNMAIVTAGDGSRVEMLPVP